MGYSGNQGNIINMSDFTDLTQKHFDYLVEKHGFACHVETEKRVVYLKATTFIQIGYGEPGEIGMTFDKNPPTRFYPFEFYLKTYYPNEESKLCQNVIRSKYEMEMEIMKLATLLQQYGQPIICGDSKMFQEVLKRALRVLNEM
jgi:hypothetical protein